MAAIHAISIFFTSGTAPGSSHIIPNLPTLRIQEVTQIQKRVAVNEASQLFSLFIRMLLQQCRTGESVNDAPKQCGKILAYFAKMLEAIHDSPPTGRSWRLCAN
ncbi:hypothetical protein [Acidithiobacillus thiooxidans]|uniref:hypothetical protein n=1 Tax=Acidithiobacillus thiooxidans TaxID=930 RepID=UPI0020CAD121|nr:hypothetical protein [Acidithiobacillus thiooxidans]